MASRAGRVLRPLAPCQAWTCQFVSHGNVWTVPGKCQSEKEGTLGDLRAVLFTNCHGNLLYFQNSNNWISTYKRIKLDPFLSPYTKLNSKCTRDFIIRARTIQFLEENLNITLHDLGYGKTFLDMTPKSQVTEEKN